MRALTKTSPKAKLERMLEGMEGEEKDMRAKSR